MPNAVENFRTLRTSAGRDHRDCTRRALAAHATALPPHPHHSLAFIGWRGLVPHRHRHPQQHHDRTLGKILSEKLGNRLNQILDTCVRPMTAKELSDVVFPQGLDPQNAGIAVGETVAHLNYLCRHGSIVRETRDNGVYLYAQR